jgi:hypothetical protein
MPKGKLLVNSMVDSELKRFLKLYFHPERIPLVIVFACCFGIVAILFPISASQLQGILLGLLGVAGTMVALIPPTAAIVETLVYREAKEIDSDLLAPDAPKRRHRLSYVFTLRSINHLLHVGSLAWVGSLYVFSAFFLILIALFLPGDKFDVFGLALQGWLAALALAFLVVGAVLFCAFALRVYRLESLELRKTALEEEYAHLLGESDN